MPSVLRVYCGQPRRGQSRFARFSRVLHSPLWLGRALLPSGVQVQGFGFGPPPWPREGLAVTAHLLDGSGGIGAAEWCVDSVQLPAGDSFPFMASVFPGNCVYSVGQVHRRWKRYKC